MGGAAARAGDAALAGAGGGLTATTEYFRVSVLVRRPYVSVELCRAVIDNPMAQIVQPDGRLRSWAMADLPPPLGRRILRVVTLADGTLHNAFIDRDYKVQE